MSRRLAEERIVSLPANEWAGLETELRELERHRTSIAGDLVIVQIGENLAAVEEPSPDERVVRKLADQAAVRRFVEQRLSQYERMWDGCGCKIDYYS